MSLTKKDMFLIMLACIVSVIALATTNKVDDTKATRTSPDPLQSVEQGD